jgi:hypothetical protein
MGVVVSGPSRYAKYAPLLDIELRKISNEIKTYLDSRSTTVQLIRGSYNQKELFPARKP